METRSTSLELTALSAMPAGTWHDFAELAGELCRLVFPHAQVSMRVMPDSSIRSLNKAFRGVDSATDVLSFPVREYPQPLALGEAARLTGHAGDIALSWDAVERQARANRNSAVTEAAALVTHSLLHLAGYDHRDAEEQAKMDAMTIELCRAVGVEVERFGH